ncbi:lysoplasmalogenase [Leptobacterium flavescens]|uniref:Lysoplasmalogenase n=1 Tax=Leptobacterium flavescens TaxID=472055 RepID=A0A6P0URW3_9FLAO|nr:lysoplasmalogenase [Leptobacterium flavescens]NER14718.1 lysoplasmalogenase [Leptobacterium flavescens]
MTSSGTKSNYFLLLFLFLVVLDLVLTTYGLSLYRQFSKPLILLSLLIYFGVSGKKLQKKIYLPAMLALGFSLLGDIFLLYDGISGTYFILGLLSFLTAHIFYSITFLRQRALKNPPAFNLFIAALLAYSIFLFSILKPQLGALMLPVIIYILVILFMAITSVKRYGRVNKNSFLLVFAGALFFLASDSILALNKFLTEIPLSHIWVMGTYAAAQFLIVKGLLTSLNDSSGSID